MKPTFFLFLFLLSLCCVHAEDPAAEDISFLNSPVGDVLTFYERLSGKRIIRDNNLNNLTVTIVAAHPLKTTEARRFVEAGLLLNGVALVPSGPDAMKAISTANRKPGGEGLPLISGSTVLPDADTVITYFMPLKFLKAQELKKLYESQVQLHDYGVVNIAPGTNALLITENASVIRHFVELQELLDKEPTSVVNHFVNLSRSDAVRVSELVMESLKSEGSDAVPKSGESKALSMSNADGVRLIPDKRTNRILVICPPTSFSLVRTLIGQFDEPAEVPGAKSIVLRFVSAVDIIQVLVDALSQTEEVAAQQQSAPAIPRAQPVQPTQVSYGSTGGATSGSPGTISTRSDQLMEETDPAPLSFIVGKTWIAADPKANKIMISGPHESVDKVKDVIGQLDQKPKQVYLATVIGQLTLGDGMLFGIDYLQHFTSDGHGTGVASALIANSGKVAASNANGATSGNILDPVNLVQPSTIVSALNGLTIYGTIGGAVEYYVRALETTNRFKVLSRPVVYTSNNKKAKIATGQRIPVPVNTLSTAGTTITTASVQSTIAYQDVLLKLEVIPLINANGDVTLKIAQTNDSVAGNQEVSGNSIPIIGTQELNTTITVPNGKTIVLGGLVSEQTTRDTSGIPWLSRIPALGYLFRTTDKKTSRQELLIFIQPVVVDDIESAQIQSDIEQQHSEIRPHFDPVAPDVPDLPLEKTSPANKKAFGPY